MRLICTLIFVFVVLLTKGQLFDSIGQFTKEPPRLVVKTDMRGSFISTKNVRIVGLKVGFEHAQRFQYGIGYSFLLSSIERFREVPVQGSISTRLRIGYITPYVDYAFYQRGHWEVRLPVQVGLGAGSVIYKDPEGRKHKLLHTPIFFYEPAMTVQYRFLGYFGMGGGLGYRIAIQTRERLGEQLSAPVYMFGLKVFFGDIWKDIQKKLE